ncbi:MAG: GNAT family N-acetyltransferase [Alphaproteobacteria bacterium]|nr:GNAT family N-acetyltransferase [Alphaproteobacteria bacterium]
MNGEIELCENQASVAQIAEHLRSCDYAFVPPLSRRVSIDDYARRIIDRADRFEAWEGGELVGLVAAYCNDVKSRVAFITSVSVLFRWQGKGIASQLVSRCTDHANSLGFSRIELEVGQMNAGAIALYNKHGFVIGKENGGASTMYLNIRSEQI